MAEYRDATPINFNNDYDKSKVDSRVAERTKAVREKMYGLDVRESMAQAAEISSVVSVEAKTIAVGAEVRQTEFEERYDAQIAENTDLNEVIDARKPEGETPFVTLGKRLDASDTKHQSLKNEVTTARSSYPNLNSRLTADKEQLETLIDDNRDHYRANSKGFMTLPVYNTANDYQATHPHVLHATGGWNGYEYWMGMTPYEKSNEWLENPSVLCSHDGLTWQVPPGGSNPLATTDDAANMHHSDTHLVLANNRLECWYRRSYRGSNPLAELILRKTSTDGITWSAEEIMYEQTGTGDNVLCPVVHFDDGKYRMWFCNFFNNRFEYFESDLTGKMAKIKNIAFPVHPKNTDLKPWHMDIIKTGNLYELFYCASYQDNPAHPYDRPVEICYATSDDNETYTFIETLMVNMPNNYDSSRLYRPCVVDVGTARRMYYSGSTLDDNWYIGLTVAPLSDKTRFVGVEFTNMVNVDGTMAKRFAFPNGLKVDELQIGQHAKLTETELKLVKPGVADMRFVLNAALGKMVLMNYVVNNNPEIGKMLVYQMHLWDDILDSDTRYFTIKNGKPIYFDGKYLQHLAVDMYGVTAERPVGPYSGQTFFDATLNKPIWFNGTGWVDATGAGV